MNLVMVPQELPGKIYKASENGISIDGLNYHFEIWQGIISRYNNVILNFKKNQLEVSPLKQVNESLRAFKLQYQSNYATHVHHKLYFDGLGGEINQPIGSIESLIIRQFGSYENWCNEWKYLGRSARAWVFLGYDYLEDRLFNYIGDGQYLGCMWDQFCLLAMDVTEHAYYFDFLNNRPDYIDAYLKSIDWEVVENRFQRSKNFLK